MTQGPDWNKVRQRGSGAASWPKALWAKLEIKVSQKEPESNREWRREPVGPECEPKRAIDRPFHIDMPKKLHQAKIILMFSLDFSATI